MDHDEVSAAGLQDDRPLPRPRVQAVRGRHEPAVEVAHHHDPVGEGREAPGHPLGGLGRAVEVPQVLDLLGVQPGLDVGEQAAVDLQSGPEAGHEVEDPVAVTPPVAGGHVRVAEPEVVVTPDPARAGLGQKFDGLLQAVGHPAHVAEHDEPVDALALEDPQRPPQRIQGFMDVREDADPHGPAISRQSVRRSENADGGFFMTHGGSGGGGGNAFSRGPPALPFVSAFGQLS